MLDPYPSSYLVPFDGSFKIGDSSTSPPEEMIDKAANKGKLKTLVREFRELQRMLYAHDKYAVLLVFQAMDAAGKDSTIRRVMTGVNPAGFQVFSFKTPSSEELDHDFLWRTSKNLPERGRIGVFNRSYYEEVLVVKVHPKFLDYQKLSGEINTPVFWEARYKSIRDHEEHLAKNGVVILKFWLNVSKEEQKNRFISRLDEPEKHWKFSEKDVAERDFWDDFMQAYEQAIRETSKPWAPWYAIPADNKPFMRATVAEVIVQNLKRLDMHYPQVSPEDVSRFDEMRRILEDK